MTDSTFDAALRNFNLAAQELSTEWIEGNIEVEDYPAYLPSFDEFAADFADVKQASDNA